MLPPTPAPTEQRITLRAEQLICEEAVADPTFLIDEPGVEAPQRAFFPGWESAWRYPVHVTIDLGAERKLTRLFFYIETGGGELRFSTGKPFSWSGEKVAPRDGYKSWKEVALGEKTRYVRLTLPAPASVPELIVFAEPSSEKSAPAPPKKLKIRARMTMDRLIGVNAFIDDPIETITGVAGFVREYHSWSWDTEHPDRTLRFQPSAAAGGNSWFFDDYYKKLKATGADISPALQGNIAGKSFDARPEPADHAAYLFQFAARYGAKKIPDSQLELAPGQPRASGLNLLRYIENGNEWDKTWKGREGWTTPFELAALSAADQDALRQADPSLKLVLAGLIDAETHYLSAMKFWADHRRGGRFPADVLNVHHYCSDGIGQSFGKTGVSPEANDLRGRMERLSAWRTKNVPEAELWLTEFGWDTDPRSPIHCPALGKMDAKTVQAAWLVRSYLLLAAAGVERAAMFMLRDVNSSGGGVFETCGLVTQKGEWKPKPSWFWVATLKNRLKGFRFVGDIPTGDKNIRAMRFSDGAREAIALWRSTSEDGTTPGFRLPMKTTSSAEVVSFETGSTTGQAVKAPIADGILTLDVTERPVLIFPSKKEK